jgi:hypothetical protein
MVGVPAQSLLSDLEWSAVSVAFDIYTDGLCDRGPTEAF